MLLSWTQRSYDDKDIGTTSVPASKAGWTSEPSTGPAQAGFDTKLVASLHPARLLSWTAGEPQAPSHDRSMVLEDIDQMAYCLDK